MTDPVNNTVNNGQPVNNTANSSTQSTVDAAQSDDFQNQLQPRGRLNINGGSGDDYIEINGQGGQGGNIDGGSGDDTIIFNVAQNPPQPFESDQQPQTTDQQQPQATDQQTTQPTDQQSQTPDQLPPEPPAPLNIDTGSGDDYVEINGQPGPNMNIDTGSGDDTVIINAPPIEPEPVEPEPEPVEPEPSPSGDGDGDGGGGDDPLVLDMDRDGMVEATAGTGVDIDGDGKADGAASGGDKMLAMTDLNGNGNIDGTEVFGNETINPFTGERLNAANGFEALEMIAESAEEYTGIDCMDDDGLVDVQKLKTALEKVGVGLGLISDDNTTVLESLGDVAAIDTNYVEQDDSGSVQHRQLGNYTTTEGQTYQADDIWFKS